MPYLIHDHPGCEADPARVELTEDGFFCQSCIDKWWDEFYPPYQFVKIGFDLSPPRSSGLGLTHEKESSHEGNDRSRD